MLMTAYRQVLCIAGTHGKTTTTSMMSCIALAAQADPTIMVGTYLPAIGGTLRIGAKDLFIAESCEYCNSFLNFPPTIAVVLNVEEDHLDFFSGLSDIVASFRAFCLKTPEQGGVVVANRDDPGARMVIENLPRRVITFGRDSTADVYPQNITLQNGYYAFDVYHQGEKLVSVQLQVPGLHNMTNALACCAASLALGFSPAAMAAGLSQFTGSAPPVPAQGDGQTAPWWWTITPTTPARWRPRCARRGRWILIASSACSSPIPTPAPRRCIRTSCNRSPWRTR